MQSKMHRNASVDVLYKQGTDRLCRARVCGLSNFFFVATPLYFRLLCHRETATISQ